MTRAYKLALEIFASGQLTLEELRRIKEAVDQRILFETPPHVCADPRRIRVGGKKIDLLTTGHVQRLQIKALQEWLTKYLAPALGDASEADLERWGRGQVGFNELVDILIAVLDADALVELGMIVTREDRDFVESNFDLSWIVDGAVALIRYTIRDIRTLWRDKLQK